MKSEKNIYSDVQISTRKFLCFMHIMLQLKILVITNILVKNSNEKLFSIIEENNERVIIIMKIYLR